MARIKGNEELFKLIHALTPEEKGYFKKFVARHSVKGGAYIKIFDDISAQSIFDETSLKKKYKSYTVQKVYLFESIMESLMIYQRASDGQDDSYYNAIFFQILFKKNLLDKAEQIVRKTLETVSREENFAMQIRFLQFKLNIGKRLWGRNEWLKNYTSLHEEIEQVRAKEINRDKYWHINHILYYEGLKMIVEYPYQPRPDELIDVDFLKNTKNPLSLTADRMRLYCLGRYYYVKRDYKMLAETYGEMYRFESLRRTKDPAIFDKVHVSASLRGLLSAYLDGGDGAKAKAIFEREWRMDEHTKEGRYDNYIQDIRFDSVENYIHYCQFHSMIYWESREYKKVIDLIRREEGKIMPLQNKYAGPIYDIMVPKILSEFCIDDLRAAMISISDFESMNIKKDAPVKFKDCQWMKILIQLKMKNYELAQNLCINFLKNDKVHSFSKTEKECLMQLKKVSIATVKESLSAIKKINKNAEKPVSIFGFVDLTECIGKL